MNLPKFIKPKEYETNNIFKTSVKYNPFQQEDNDKEGNLSFAQNN